MYFQQDCPFEYVVTLPCTYPEVYPGLYEVSNDGRVFNVEKGFELKACMTGKGYLNNNGYLTMRMKTIDDGNKLFKVHRLVAWEFCNPPINCAELTVNHIDGNNLNNMYWNLEWCTNRENIHHAIETGLFKIRGEDSANHKLTEQDVIEICEKLKDPTIKVPTLAKLYNIAPTRIHDIANGVAWTHITSQFPPLPKRLHYGQYHPMAKLTEEQVHQIHQTKQHYPNLSYQELADQFNVSNSCICEILTGRTWKQIYSLYNPPSSQSAESGDQT